VPAIAVSTVAVVGGAANVAAGAREFAEVLTTTGSGGGSRAGKPFTAKGKQAIIDANRAANNGVVRCENCGTETVPAQKSASGVKPPPNETQIDHVIPKAKGGDGSPENAQVLCRSCNRQKSDNLP
jgi:hypothetical protein